MCVISLITLAAFDLTLLHTKAKKRTTSFGSISSVPYTEKRRTTSFDSNSTSPYIYTQMQEKKDNLLWIHFNLTFYTRMQKKEEKPPLDPFRPYLTFYTQMQNKEKATQGAGHSKIILPTFTTLLVGEGVKHEQKSRKREGSTVSIPDVVHCLYAHRKPRCKTVK